MSTPRAARPATCKGREVRRKGARSSSADNGLGPNDRAVRQEEFESRAIRVRNPGSAAFSGSQTQRQLQKRARRDTQRSVVNCRIVIEGGGSRMKYESRDQRGAAGLILLAAAGQKHGWHQEGWLFNEATAGRPCKSQRGGTQVPRAIDTGDWQRGAPAQNIKLGGRSRNLLTLELDAGRY